MLLIRSCRLMLLCLLLLVAPMPRIGSAASDEPIRVFVNGEQVLFSQQPIVEDGNTLVQLRPFYETLGIPLEWDAETQTITTTVGEAKFVMTINSTDAIAGGTHATLEVAPRIVNETTFVPLRYLVETFGGEVAWDQNNHHINIVTDRGYYVYIAAKSNDLEKVKIALDNKGRAGFASKADGLTTLNWAMYHNNNAMIELLLKSGADANQSLLAVGDFLRPLDKAVIDQNPSVVRLLVDYGADPSHRTKEGTALDLATNLLQKEQEQEQKGKQRLEQIVAILKQAAERDAKLLAQDTVLIPFNGGKPPEIFKGEFGTWGYLDREGKEAIKMRFAFAFPFSEGLAFAANRLGESGYIDQTGRFKFTFDFRPEFFPGDFKEGLAPVGKQDKWGFIDKTGAFAIEPAFDRARPFSEGLASVQVENKWGAVNHAGQLVVAPVYDDVLAFHHGLAIVRGERSGFINTKGELVIDFQALGISEYGTFQSDLAPVIKKGKVGYIDMKGALVIPAIYDNGYDFAERTASVAIDGKYGFIDEAGKLIIDPQFEWAYSYRNGKAFVKSNGKWGFINRKGEPITPFEYDWADNLMGNDLLGSQYISFSDRADGMALLHRGDRKFYVFPDGQIVPFQLQ